MAPSVSRSIWSRVTDVASLAATPLVPSHYLELVSPLHATHARAARVESVVRETEDASTLTLRPGRGWRGHRAGQFVAVGAEIEGRIVTRTYSIASAPDRADGRVAITVKVARGGKMSGHLARNVRQGDYLTLGEAQGDFTFSDAPHRPALFVTGGSGITPVMSMLRSFAFRGAMPDVVHLHYAPRPADVIFRDELARLGARHSSYHLVVVSTREPSGERFGRATLAQHVPDWESRETWACGPRSLLAAVEDTFAPPRSFPLHVERFQPVFAPPDGSACGGRVRFGRSRTEVEANGQTPLLEVAERAGVNAPHGCRMGICHSCDASLVSGSVRDLRTGRVVGEPGARVQICVCAAAGDVELAV